MGLRGPQPKPVELKVLEGNPGKRRLPKVPKFAPLTEHAPEELTPIGRALWRRLHKEFAGTNLLQRTDRESLIMLCDLWSVYRENMVIVRQESALAASKMEGTYFGKKAPANVVSPAWRIARDAAKEFASLASRFGLTPADRIRLGSLEAKEDDDPFIRLLD